MFAADEHFRWHCVYYVLPYNEKFKNDDKIVYKVG